MKKVYIENINSIKINNNMPKSFKNYLERYHNSKRLNESMSAYSLLLNKLESDFNLDIKDEELILNEYNKPYLKINCKVYFNISHSKDMVAVVISDEGECGIDIEYINKDINLNIVKKYLSPSELNIFNKDKDIYYLFKMWTVKEAFYKCIGVGIFLSELKEEKDYSLVKSKIIKDNINEYYVSIDM